MRQTVEQSYEEKVKMYMKSTKKELVQMLLENQRILSKQLPMQVVFNKPLIGDITTMSEEDKYWNSYLIED